MSRITASIEVDVPIRFADREWSEFVWRTFVGNLAMPTDRIAETAGGDESEADQGVVRFETKGDRLTKVVVELDYTPYRAEDAEVEEAQVRSRLERDLELYRSFLLRRCDETSCRTEWRET
jgi:uncharacterized membrane protein